MSDGRSEVGDQRSRSHPEGCVDHPKDGFLLPSYSHPTRVLPRSYSNPTGLLLASCVWKRAENSGKRPENRRIERYARREEKNRRRCAPVDPHPPPLSPGTMYSWSARGTVPSGRRDLPHSSRRPPRPASGCPVGARVRDCITTERDAYVSLLRGRTRMAAAGTNSAGTPLPCPGRRKTTARAQRHRRIGCRAARLIVRLIVRLTIRLIVRLRRRGVLRRQRRGAVAVVRRLSVTRVQRRGGIRRLASCAAPQPSPEGRAGPA